jgi:ribulose kinase
MAIVGGVDYGTLSVRVTLLDSIRGRLSTASAEYPLRRKREDPNHATQSHADHMNALVAAKRHSNKSRFRNNGAHGGGSVCFYRGGAECDVP